MDRAEFDKWITDHYQDLMAVARKRVGVEDAEDAVQAALLRALETDNYTRCKTDPLVWIMQAVKSAASNARRSRERSAAMQERLQPETSHVAPGGRGWTRPMDGVDRRAEAVKRPEAGREAVRTTGAILRLEPAPGIPHVGRPHGPAKQFPKGRRASRPAQSAA